MGEGFDWTACLLSDSNMETGDNYAKMNGTLQEKFIFKCEFKNSFIECPFPMLRAQRSNGSEKKLACQICAIFCSSNI